MRELRKLLDPVIFVEMVLGFHPFDYQKKLLRDQSKRIVACMGRQTGKSTTIAAKAIHFALINPNTTILIVSATLRQSMLMFDKILGFIESSPLLKKSVKYKTRTRIRFSNGSLIIALPCGRYGHSLRGHTAHLIILDEAAFIPEEVITNVVFPMISTTDGAVWMLSTPWSRDHIFYKAFTSPEWSVYHLPSSVNPLIKPEFLKEQRELIGEERFRLEYEAEFIDEERSFFPSTLIMPCSDDYDLKWEPGLFVGYDPGGRDSLAAIVGVKLDQGIIKVSYLRTFVHMKYADVNAFLADLHTKGPIARLFVDQTGLGNPIIEHLTELNLPVEGVVLTPRNKEEILSNLRLKFEQKKIIIPRERELLAHLNAVEYERKRDGGYKWIKGAGHDDLAFALALAVKAAEGGEGVIVF